MGMYKAIKELWKSPKANLGELYKQRLIEWRRQDVFTEIKRPTRLDRARSLGYRAKKGFFLTRVRVLKGAHTREFRHSGRRSKTMRRLKIVGMSYQWIAEQKAQRKHKNLQVLNSYYVGEDGVHKWFEVILVDTHAPEIISDKTINWITKQNDNRVFRGQTSAARKSRGLRRKGTGAEKLRPSRRAHNRLAK
ncbi:50S ribosomal protein L15e [Candidatus Woesearchaeota archaeon]|nr:50S ribosomal protein L15e [Candidatus Woesearchaeota archaeon]